MSRAERSRIAQDFGGLDGWRREFVSTKLKIDINTSHSGSANVIIFCIESTPLDDPIL